MVELCNVYDNLQQCRFGIDYNGILKQKSKASWRAEKIKNPELKITNADGITHLMNAINELSVETIKNSFHKSCFMKNI